MGVSSIWVTCWRSLWKVFLLILCKALSPATKSQPRVNSDITQSQNQKQLIFHSLNLSWLQPITVSSSFFCSTVASPTHHPPPTSTWTQFPPLKGFHRDFLTFGPTQRLSGGTSHLWLVNVIFSWFSGDATCMWGKDPTLDFLGGCCPSPAPPPFLPLVTSTPSPTVSSAFTPGIFLLSSSFSLSLFSFYWHSTTSSWR